MHDAPLTWGAIPHAVEMLSRNVASTLPPNATLTGPEDGMKLVDAARILQRMVAALNPLMVAMLNATGLHRGRDGAAPSLEATAVLTDALWHAALAFDDLDSRGAAEAPRALSRMLASVEAGRRPAFSRSAKQARHRATAFPEARIMGLAACMLDALMRAEPEIRMSVHAGKVALVVEAATGTSCNSSQVESWRHRCRAKSDGEKGSKPFGPTHPARGGWETYEHECLHKWCASGGPPAGWGAVAAEYGKAIKAAIDRKPQSTDRNTTRFQWERLTGSG